MKDSFAPGPALLIFVMICLLEESVPQGTTQGAQKIKKGSELLS